MASQKQTSGISAVSDLGMGSSLADQVKDQTEEERRKKMLGLSMMQSPAAQMLLGSGMNGRTF